MKNLKIEIKKYSDVYKIKEEEIVVIKVKPSLKLISRILDVGSKVKTICISERLYGKIKEKAWEVLEDFGIRVNVEKGKRGRKKKYLNIERKIIEEVKKSGIRKTAKKFGIPKSSVYNIVRRENGKGDN